ncbi:B12-binding domain-containing radical SAM protein [Streptosporangium sp. CA-115845]|uniref:B12-binding domain-containing radical SAM protein n=1 Tax=Streptosporangium sp. CA-115845 TaxID=3240071 RepID=UPI003D8A157B
MPPTAASLNLLLDAVDRLRLTPLTAAQQQTIREVPYSQPNRLRDVVAGLLPGHDVVLAGTLERRLLAATTGRPGTWLLADLSGQPHETRAWPGWAAQHLRLHTPGRWVSRTDLTGAAVARLTRPRILLAALYRPEYFPLPRFPLAISDLARAARSTLSGQVNLMDMQLGATLDDIIGAVRAQRPDILGVSATFGQHDLMTRLLDAVQDDVPLVLAGGSLTVRNEALLLERYPQLLIARGAGEPTIRDVIAHWHGDLERDQIHGIGYVGAARGGAFTLARRRTAVVPNRDADDFFPELDLMQDTFAHQGVAQLETTRGCTSKCSFCPRGHKGAWAGGAPEQLPWMLAALDEEFNRHPGISRTLYLVDEEAIGRGDDAVPRALAVAAEITKAGFRWETSCRIDQVAHPGHDTDWHVERAHMWRTLVRDGLRRCLFGVESGVTSILERFNKETTAEQNALGIRTLSALGTPTRFTYITFDQLMTVEELRATHAFLGRTDLLLRPLPHLSAEQIVDGVRDPGFVAEHSTGRPFYTGVSYMLVSMECLIGAAYTRQVQAAGLAGQVRPSMGRVDAAFADSRIGVCSERAQLWVDRNFAIDYTLKSLEKVLDGEPRRQVRAARVVIKDAAFTILTGMINLVDGYVDPSQGVPLTAGLDALLDAEFDRLRDRMATTVPAVVAALPGQAADRLVYEHQRWAASTGWELINAADPCGT